MSRRIFCLLTLLLVPALSFPVGADTILARSVLANGGGEASGTHYMQIGTLGQACIGVLTGALTIHEVGFWYPIPSGPSAAEPAAGELPTRFALTLSSPHPSRCRLAIHFAVPVRSAVAIDLYDVGGRRVVRLVDSIFAPGYHAAELTARELSSGIYFCRMTADGFIQTRRLTLLR